MQTHCSQRAVLGLAVGARHKKVSFSAYTTFKTHIATTQTKPTPTCSKRKPLLSCHVPNLPLLPLMKEGIDMPFQSAPEDNLVETKPNNNKIILPWLTPKPARNRSGTLTTHYQEENPLLSSVTAIAEIKPSRTTQPLHLILTSCCRDDNPDLRQPQRTASLNQD